MSQQGIGYGDRLVICLGEKRREIYLAPKEGKCYYSAVDV